MLDRDSHAASGESYDSNNSATNTDTLARPAGVEFVDDTDADEKQVGIHGTVKVTQAFRDAKLLPAAEGLRSRMSYSDFGDLIVRCVGPSSL